MNRAFDRVLIARHFALSAGAIAAYVFRQELAIGVVALWIVGISTCLNFLAYLFQSRPGMSRFSVLASPVIGLTSWTALVLFTNGVYSPFIAGLWLEIVLSAMALRLQGVALVTIASVVGLWAQQWVLGIDGEFLRLILQSGFLVGMGLATFLVTRRWLLTRKGLDRDRADLDVRLAELNRQLEDDRVVAELGENVARLAHGLKNAVHSLRGFVRLIEPKVAGQTGVGPAIAGLRSAIDDLEALAHLTLGSKPAPESSPTAAQRPQEAETGAVDASLGAVLARAAADVSAAQPNVHIEVRAEALLPRIALSDKSFEEVLVILLRNAAEAMNGVGRVELLACTRDAGLFVSLADEGPGLRDVDVSEIFKPGYTTKPGGSGYGLFLARRIVEEHGGKLVMRSGDERGAVVELALPAAASSEGAD